MDIHKTFKKRCALFIFNYFSARKISEHDSVLLLYLCSECVLIVCRRDEDIPSLSFLSRQGEFGSVIVKKELAAVVGLGQAV